MRLTVVGCSGSYPGPRSAASCYLLEADDARILLDLGNGALGPLQRYTDLDDITAVLLSHLHPDHCADLCGFYVYRRYHPDGPRPPGPVYGPRGVADQVSAMYGRGHQQDLRRQFDFVEWKPGTVSVGPFTVTVARVAHPVETYGIRVENAGRVLAYSGDTGPCDALTRLAGDADILLSEAAFLEGIPHPPQMHLTGREAGECAEQAGAGRLIVTHIPPWNDPQRSLAEAASAYHGPIDLAQPGLTIDV
jgi:ribonuclease BN (tRNA processing enzyme)